MALSGAIPVFRFPPDHAPSDSWAEAVKFRETAYSTFKFNSGARFCDFRAVIYKGLCLLFPNGFPYIRLALWSSRRVHVDIPIKIQIEPFKNWDQSLHVIVSRFARIHREV